MAHSVIKDLNNKTQYRLFKKTREGKEKSYTEKVWYIWPFYKWLDITSFIWFNLRAKRKGKLRESISKIKDMFMPH